MAWRLAHPLRKPLVPSSIFDRDILVPTISGIGVCECSMGHRDTGKNLVCGYKREILLLLDKYYLYIKRLHSA